jgi:hypothetical protein
MHMAGPLILVLVLLVVVGPIIAIAWWKLADRLSEGRRAGRKDGPDAPVISVDPRDRR